MAITTMDQLVAAIAASQDISFVKTQATAPAVGFFQSLWGEAGNPAAGSLSIGNTTNGVVPTDATAGSPIINAFSGAVGYVASFAAIGTQPGAVVLYDRLFHAGSFTMGTLQTNSLSSQPSFSGRVPGSNWGECEIWVEINTANGATAPVISVGYQDGTNSAQTTGTVTLPNSVPTKRTIPMPMANSSGVQRINSLIVATATGTGSINVVVVRRLCGIVFMAANLAEPRQDFFKTGGQIVFADSCLALAHLGANTTAGTIFADLQIING